MPEIKENMCHSGGLPVGKSAGGRNIRLTSKFDLGGNARLGLGRRRSAGSGCVRLRAKNIGPQLFPRNSRQSRNIIYPINRHARPLRNRRGKNVKRLGQLYQPAALF